MTEADKRHPRYSVRIACITAMFTLLFFPLAYSNADTAYQSIESIRNISRLFVRNQFTKSKFSPEIEIGQLDPRLRLAKCETKLEPFAPQGRLQLGNGIVGVRCSGNKPWVLYVPTKISGHGDVVVMTRNRKRGDILTASDLRFERRDLSRLNPGYYLSIQELLGKQLKRPLMNGNVVRQPAVEEPDLIKRGQSVMLIADNKGISVQMKAKALSDGKQGERIRVKNLSSNRIIEGTVLRRNVVRIEL